MIHTTFTREPREGDLIRGDVRVPEGPPPRSAIVVVHGFKGFKDWGFFPYTCERLAEAGHAVVSFNMSHNGVGEDLMSFSELDSFGAGTLSLELDEVLGIVDEVLGGEHGEDEGSTTGGSVGSLLPEHATVVGVLGHSRGGGQTVLAAAEDDRVEAIVTWAAVGTFDRWSDQTKAEWRAEGRMWVANLRTRQQMPLDVGLLEDFEANRTRLDISSAAARLRAPWLIVHGLADETVDVDEARTLADAAQHGELLLIEGAGHTFGARHPFQETTPELEQVVDATVAHFARLLSS